MKNFKIKSKFFLIGLILFIMFSAGTLPAFAQNIITGLTSYPGQEITIDASSYKQTDSSWVGFYKSGTEDNQYYGYSYIKDLTNGRYTVIAPKEIGLYEFRFFKDGGYVKVGTSDVVQVIQYTPSLTTDKSTYLPNDTITVTYSNASIIDGAWIGFFGESAQDNAYSSYEYTGGKPSGTMTVTAPSQTGKYQFRIFLDGAYTKIGESPIITVGEFTPTLTPSKLNALVGETLSVSFSNASTLSGAWVGLYKYGEIDTAYIEYKYTDSKLEGNLEFAMPTAAGTYEFRIFKDSGYTKIATSPLIIVDEFKPTITPSKLNALVGETLSISFSNASTLSNAWIGLYKSGADDKAYVSYKYTDNKVAGNLEFVMPNEVGNYEFRIFKDSGYTRIGVSSQIVLSTKQTPQTQIPQVQIPQTTDSKSEVFESGTRFSWPARNSILGYRLFRSTNQSELGISVTDFYLTGTSYADVNVLPKTTYYYTVKTVVKESNPLAGVEEELGETVATFVVTTGDTVYKSGSQKNFIILQLENPKLNKNGILEEIDVGRGTVPIIISGRTMVPIRAVVEAMGGKIEWDNSTQKITISARNNKIEVWVNKTDIVINGVKSKMDVSPAVRNGRTYVPVRFIAENLNSKVDWINSTKEAVIIFED